MRLTRGRPETERRKEFLATHDAPCPSCGYNLRGVDTLYCPECARVLDLPSLMEMRAPEPWYGRAARRTWRAWMLGNMLLFIGTAGPVARNVRWGPVGPAYGALFGSVVLTWLGWRWGRAWVRPERLERVLTRCWWALSAGHVAFVFAMLT